MASREADILAGKQALMHFHNRASAYANYKLTFDELLAHYGKFIDNTLEGIGFLIGQMGLSYWEVKQAMEELANEGQGRIPATHADYMNYLGKQAKVNWTAAAADVAQAIATETSDGLVSFGENVKTLLSFLNWVLVPAVVIGGGYILLSKIRKAAA